jgi:PKD repeat protein
MALFTSDPNPSDAGQSVSFDAGASSDQDSVGASPGIAQYHWNFGDGTTTSSATPSASHSYAVAGTYRVSLSVVDDDGESSSTEALQTVRESTATVSAGGNVPVEGGKANFSADNGRVVWHDHARKVKVQSTHVTSVTRNGSTATITGQCKVNKRDTATFVLELTDGASDTARIQVGDYVAGGTVSGGDVMIR